MARMSDDVPRILSNLIRYGTVAAVQVDPPRVRVAIGSLLTQPLPWCTARAGTVSWWSPPSVGEQVVVFSPHGDLAAGFVLPALHADHAPPPDGATRSNTMLAFADGARLSYDPDRHALTVSLPSGGTNALTAPAGVSIDGNVRITGDLAIDGTAHASGDVTSDGDVRAGTISLTNHSHAKVQPGSGISGKPLP